MLNKKGAGGVFKKKRRTRKGHLFVAKEYSINKISAKI